MGSLWDHGAHHYSPPLCTGGSKSVQFRFLSTIFQNGHRDVTRKTIIMFNFFKMFSY